ncbi:MAG: O-acetyl-ADP-ribose deacetylase [Kiloniellales bacterium]|jgi:O-acetyl-ADP-ribose deacetylase (regulator of RNase III)|nr:O-acetyl-ADP-ribose deacetylase [Kiloniellales bacterium]
MSDPRIEIHAGDITKLDVGAIVNAANDRLAPGGGVCGAIHRAAGPELARECARIGHCPTGEARITGGYALPAKHVIHAVGPVWRGGAAGEAEQLAGCYRMSLELAKDAGVASIAFPAISTGIFGYPIDQATRVAVETVGAWLAQDDAMERVIFCVFGAEVEDAYREALGR